MSIQSQTSHSTRLLATQYASLVVVAVVVIASLLLGYAASRQQGAFEAHEKESSFQSTAYTSEQLQLYFAKESQLLGLFIDSNRDLLRNAISNDRSHKTATRTLTQRLEKNFPNVHNYTVADEFGNLLLRDPFNWIGNSCKLDLAFRAQKGHADKIYVHNVPHGKGLHIDLIEEITLPNQTEKQVMLISLGLQGIQNILDKGAMPGHKLYLANPRKDKIEASSDDHSGGNPRLTPGEIFNIGSQVNVPGTRWVLIDSADTDLIKEHKIRLFWLTVAVILGLTLMGILMLWFIRREENRRLIAERNLQLANEELEHKVTSRTAELLESRSELEYLVAHDPLTGLLNRREFSKQIDFTLHDAHTNHIHSVLFYIDLDQFKVVNDTAGHSAGDELLRQLAERLKKQLRKGDTLARLGGDEFGVVLHSCSLDQALEIAEKLRSTVREHKFSWSGMQFGVGASIGIVPITPTAENSQALMAAADAACYTAKELGRNQVHVFEAEREQEIERAAQMRQSQDVEIALKDGRCILYYQPIHYLGKHPPQFRMYEVLIRMYDKDGRLLTPEQFVPAAERFGHMTELDLWVSETALKWLSQGAEDIRLNVNLSGQSLSNPQALIRIHALLDRYSGVQNRICFEITETAAVGNFSHAREFISSLRKRGCRFALDDYGSGVCSFSYLRNLPVDSLKIDGELVKEVVSDPIATAMVSSIARMAKAMNLTCVAEYVENEILMLKIQSMGIDYGQGHYFGKPGPLDELK